MILQGTFFGPLTVDHRAKGKMPARVNLAVPAFSFKEGGYTSHRLRFFTEGEP